MYKTFVIDYNPQTARMAEAVEEKANEIAGAGFKVLSFSVTNSGKAIILAETSDTSSEG
ncbi:MAG: hypothetical protein MSS48_08105 [Clostridiales bacterium]|uniref:hypothetical protein n=1 Tax=Hornefia butyriciproducens TaxID=2652293 RepID=UPI0029FCC16D|nr:hypothetical protein [Hornefia butyriciproducens]MCI7326035.1 hypothetical protein [Clostridiales bacterium]MCI7412539.1 hypothetical protein [Clostridiales bacterium]MCI7680154.1 hypothetical protein [Clostridiales bacterium]MDD7019892.1 hypothetical protein [Hornefia butyriciproducens]MDY2991909.1 hypothetical protein [Hornefia butyriciproducens]